jgi:nucleoside-diphosphate-sugar epimerase
MNKLLFTGFSGFLGKNTIRVFERDGYSISTCGNKGGDYTCDLRLEVPQFEEQFNLVIHAAGKAHSIPKTENEIQEFYAVNVTGTLHLLQGLEISGLPMQFVFISSVSVYGLVTGKLITEEVPLLAKDPYGLSKIEAELLVTEWCKKNNVVCTILRLPLLVGENPPGNLGAMLQAIDNGYYFNIGGGKARKSMVLVQDVAVLIPKVATIGGIYNLTDGFHPNFKELSSVISRQKKKKKPYDLPMFIAKLVGYAGDLLGRKAPINSLKLKKITSDLTFDDTKARNVAGWNPHCVLEYFESNEN